jgi:hypothetical protein
MDSSPPPKKILLIAQADSINTVKIVEKIRKFNPNINIDLFPSSVFTISPELAKLVDQCWNPNINYDKFTTAEIYWQDVYEHPKPSCSPSADVLAKILELTNYNIVHILGLQQGAYLYAEAIEKLTKQKPYTILNLWGNCLYYFARHTNHKKSVVQALSYIDKIHTEAERDLNIALELGYREKFSEIIMPTIIWPELISEIASHQTSELKPLESRPFIAVKGSGAARGRGFNAIHALKKIAKDIPSNLQVIAWNVSSIDMAEFNIDRPSNFSNAFPMIPRGQLYQIMANSRILISLNTTDGTPNLFFEAYASGAYGIFSADTALQQFNDITDVVPSISLVDPNNTEQISQIILDTLHKPSNLLEDAVKKCCAKLMIRQATQRVENFYNRLYVS